MSGRILSRLRSPRSAPWLRLTRVPAFSALSFASGFVVLTVPGPSLSRAEGALVFATAAFLAVMILGFSGLVVVVESLTGRAVVSGFLRLNRHREAGATVTARTRRLASSLWIANGAALWLAVLLSRW